jgi:cytochrome c oxidase cbb3-type subunit 3
MADKPELDELTGTETTGHSWDGISELNTPLPKWWLYTFYACIVYSVGYVIAYPAIPLINGATQGALNWSSRAAVASEIADHKAGQAEWIDRVASTELEDIRTDNQLQQFAFAAGKSAFGVHCSQCHGSGAQGFTGYPNLNDDDWLWGGSIDDIYHTISHGVRNEDADDPRYSEMPAFGEILSKDEIGDVTQYVLALGSLEHDATRASAGEVVYTDNCSACHGEAGEGNRDMGAPRLNDALWLFGGDEDHISSQIAYPSHGVMPAWGLRLDDATVKSLAVYVHGLGGGE